MGMDDQVGDAARHGTDEQARLQALAARAVEHEATEARLRSLLDSMTEGVVVQTAGTGAIVDWNPAAERILGLTADQLAGRTSLDPRWRTVSRDGAPLPGERHPAMRVLATGEPVSDLVGVHTPEGDLRWVDVRARPVRDETTGAVTAAIATFTDVTARHDVQASRALRAAGVGTWTWFPASDAVRWSDDVGPLLGRPRGWSPGTFADFLGLVHVDDRPTVRARLEEALRTGGAYDPRYRVRWPDGSWRWLQAGDAWIERREDGTAVRVDGAIWDVTTAEASVAAQRASETRLALIYASVTDLMFLLAVERDAAGVVVAYRCESVNAAYLAITGLRESEVLGRTLEEILPPGEAAFSRTKYETVLRTGETVRYDETVHLRTGRLVVETTLAPVRDAEGRISHLLGMARDVTGLRRTEVALRESEARYRAFVDRAPDGVFVHVGPEIRYVNAAGARLLGAADPAALVGRTLMEFVVPEEREALLARLAHSIGSGDFGTAEQTLARVDTGAHVVVEVSAVPVRYVVDGVEVDAVQATLRDITERRRAEAERQALEARLQHAQKLEAVGQLAGGLAHDLNNMLFVVSGNRELVESELGATHPARALLGEMDSAIASARRLVRSLLTFSRRETVQPEALDAVEVVRAFVPLLRTATGERIALTVALPETPLRLVADRSHLEQVLMNLVVNARDALLSEQHGRAARGGTIAVTVRERQLAERERAPGAVIAPGRCLELVVRDDGHGMDDETLAHVFEPFFTTKPVGSGTGLGLATVFGIVQRMRGDVRIDSTPGAGTTVTLLFPLDASGEEAADAPTTGGVPALAVATVPAVPGSTPPASGAPTAPGTVVAGATVLLVEDEDAVRRVARRLLERAGARVLDAADGVEALAVWTAHRAEISLVVTDVRMPAMDGVELAHRLRMERADLPIVFMSGYTDRKPVQGWSERLGFLAKPFGAAELLAALVEVLAAS
jgi:PAS domain S-box-containing protein